MSTQPAYEIGTLPVWTFADKVRKARDIAGLNQKAFAEHLDITASSLGAALILPGQSMKSAPPPGPEGREVGREKCSATSCRWAARTTRA